jgi:xylan 1,4-beta-xylosidase
MKMTSFFLPPSTDRLNRAVFAMNNRAIHAMFLCALLGGCLRPPAGSGAETLAQIRHSNGDSAGIVLCNAGASCLESGLECTNVSGILCTCVGPKGAAYVTCNSARTPPLAGQSAPLAANSSQVVAASGSSNPEGVRCADSPPWKAVGEPAYRISVDAKQLGPAWNRFYENMVAADHANTVLETAWGRNIQGALRKGHELAGFQYVRFHGILDSDIGVYTEVNDKPVYNWARLDKVYDAIIAAGMRPFVEIGFMPPPLASNPAKTLHWYNHAPANISPPKDWNRWMDFMAALVQHLEQRYGAEEVRKRWYFEIWNESSWMYSLGMAGYNELYDYTVQGLVRGDPDIHVGGPAESGGGSGVGITNLVEYCRKHNRKLDFVTYHTYGQTNDTTVALAVPTQMFHEEMVGTVKKINFTGDVFVTEWGASYSGAPARDTEISASFVAKTVHLIGTDNGIAPPSGFAYWTISDLYEEFDSGNKLAFREGNYGLMLKGDPRYPDSYDVAKPAFNAFRLLHMMGETRVATTGGRTGSGVNGIATLAADGKALQMLVYNHVDGGQADPLESSLVSLQFNNIPFASSKMRVRHYLVDYAHSNAFDAFAQMGKPQQPTQSEWTELRRASELCYYETTVSPKDGAWSVMFPQNTYSVGLIVLSPEPDTTR